MPRCHFFGGYWIMLHTIFLASAIGGVGFGACEPYCQTLLSRFNSLRLARQTALLFSFEPCLFHTPPVFYRLTRVMGIRFRADEARNGLSRYQIYIMYSQSWQKLPPCIHFTPGGLPDEYSLSILHIARLYSDACMVIVILVNQKASIPYHTARI